MLDHIEYLIRRISDVSNSIAHDLRTPLAELRSRLEELSLTRPPAAETFAEIDAAVADVDRRAPESISARRSSALKIRITRRHRAAARD